MKFYIGTDHAGFEIKKDIENILKRLNCEVVDLGTYSKESVDYPDFGHKVARAVLKDEGSFGVVVCGTGIGISISANKHKGIRAALCHDAYSAKMARAHNDANILAFGQRMVGLGVIESMIEAFVTTSFEGGRHLKRVEKIEV
ncbi:MAG: ribose 5-phosphate isomerase B [Sulfurospirillaceae bacterium]|jgi:ribose 5-phosphate isomerase B|nr:ribose 5-phosphate isomerase B [Sulfurospirillaceae bacterium]MCK9545815.1 ribose 5-phosphate isomerase B [Sulfurospirillaceae bacterium]MDY0238517.1 ribose 5-phosphate isomerase B [Campylobacterales bacterium]NLM99677.1 ribose 5-phosphate isomerase B [Campylobacteraceae bacterium]